MDISQRGGMQNSPPPRGLVDIRFEAKDRKREGPVPSYIGAGLLTSLTLLLPNEGVEFILCRVHTLVSAFSHHIRTMRSNKGCGNARPGRIF